VRAYRIAYDGGAYYGFQRQPTVQTIEGTVFDALRDLDVLAAEASKPTGYAAAGRTDRGVSATHQTIAFDAPAWLSPRALNSELPAEIRAWASAPASDSFHATHHARSRAYTYFLYAPEADEQRLQTVLSKLSGTQDFHNFTPDDEGTVRTLQMNYQQDGDLFRITLSSDGFARQLVRRLISVVQAVAVDDRPLAWVDRLLSSQSVSGPDGVEPAPPEPLLLTDVSYPQLEWTVDNEAHKRTQELFRSRHRNLVGRTAVLSALADLHDKNK